MSLPIIFIHRGACRYLAGSVIQARQFNPDADIYVLGDRFNSGLQPARHYQGTDYFEGAKNFAAIYKHRSSHGIEYEGFCFQRWFMLQSFLERQNLPGCLYLDSDVLLFTDATREARRYENCDLTISQGSPHCMFINRKEELDRFCSFLRECYSCPELFARLETHYQALQARNLAGGVCDMTVFGLYQALGRGKVADLYSIREGTVYDHAMADVGGFEMQRGIKKIQWSNGEPYGRQQPGGKLIRFHTLHFQGNTKRSLPTHLRLSSIRLKMTYQWNRLLAERGKIMEKLRFTP